MSGRPIVDVCIPCFNEERYIQETVESVLNQTYKRFILHIVDNHSTDRTLQIVKQIKDPRIRIHRHSKNIGMFGNMNRCVKLAAAPYVKILCADDLLTPDCLARQAKMLTQNKSVNLVYSASRIIDEYGKTLFIRRFFHGNKYTPGKQLIRRVLTAGRNPIGEPTTVTYRNSTVKTHPSQFDLSYVHVGDLDFWIHILRYGAGYYIDKPLSSFRVHHGSSTAKVIKTMYADHRRLLKRYAHAYGLSRLERGIAFVRLCCFIAAKSLLFQLLWLTKYNAGKYEEKKDKGVRRRDV